MIISNYDCLALIGSGKMCVENRGIETEKAPFMPTFCWINDVSATAHFGE